MAEIIKIGEGGGVRRDKGAPVVPAPRRESDPARVAKFPDRATAVAAFTAMARSGALRATSQPSAEEGASERQAVHDEAANQTRLQPPGSKDRGKAYSTAAKRVQQVKDNTW
jgi:hypothetical protein